MADVALAGSLFAPHYARAETLTCIAAIAPVQGAPARTASAVSELVRGEGFAVLDVAGDWAWGYCRHDHYVGYVEASLLGDLPAPSHIVYTPAALVFSEPAIKSPVIERLPMGSRFPAQRQDNFLALERGFIHIRHAIPLDQLAFDPVAQTEALLGTPYRWGGRSGDGIDCSGLIQLAFAFAGRSVPRDSDQQAAAIGEVIDEGEPLRRGDLVFFRGHVGIMSDDTRLTHANAYWMRVTTEPLADVVARGATITVRRRP